MDMNFKVLENEIYAKLNGKLIMVLATSYQNKVYARNMSCVVIDKKIYFQTDKTFAKFDQMLNNPNVALCVDNLQIEGVATLKKHPFDEENKRFLEVFKAYHKGSYEKYSQMKNEIVVEVKPTLITLWKYEDGQPCREYLNYTSNKAYREIYDTSH